jgi:hypothetical protein
MTSQRIKEIQETTAYPESVSVMFALKQVWSECGNEMYSKEEVISLIKAREIEQGFYGAKGLTTEEWFEQFKKK